jgi:ribose transport system permease protein
MKTSIGSRVRSINFLGILFAFVILCIVMIIVSPHFLKPANLLNILQQVSINFTIAIGMTFVILIGGIDLSVGSVTALTGMIVAILMKMLNWNVALAITVSMMAACVMGMINGSLIAYLHLPPFIVTLGMMEIARGLSFSVTAGQPIYTLPAGFLAISSRVKDIPVVALGIMLTLFALALYVLRYTRFGRYVYAVGGNEACAKLSGINVNAIKVAVFTISGFCCGIASMLLTSRLDSAVPTNATGYEMSAIAAVVIGGVSMSGGEGTVFGTIIGVLMIGVIANGMNLLVIPTGQQRVVTGTIIVLAVILDVLRKRASAKAK